MAGFSVLVRCVCRIAFLVGATLVAADACAAEHPVRRAMAELPSLASIKLGKSADWVAVTDAAVWVGGTGHRGLAVAYRRDISLMICLHRACTCFSVIAENTPCHAVEEVSYDRSPSTLPFLRSRNSTLACTKALPVMIPNP